MSWQFYFFLLKPNFWILYILLTRSSKADSDECDDDNAVKKEKKEKKSKKKRKESEDEDETDASPKTASCDDDIDDDSDKAEWEREEIVDSINRMKAFIAGKQIVEKNDFAEELRLLQISCGFGKPLRLYIALEALFADNLSAKTFEEHKEILYHQGW